MQRADENAIKDMLGLKPEQKIPAEIAKLVDRAHELLKRISHQSNFQYAVLCPLVACAEALAARNAEPPEDTAAESKEKRKV